MDYIKSLYDYFRSITTNAGKENRVEDVKNDIMRDCNYSAPVPDNQISDSPVNITYEIRDMNTVDFLSNIIKIMFDHGENHHDINHIMSDPNSPWSFGGDMFRTANEMHEDFLNLVTELHGSFSDMQSFIFEDVANQNTTGCSDWGKPKSGESLRDHYLRVPTLVSQSENNADDVKVIIPGNDGYSAIISTDSPSNSMMPHFHETQQIVSISVSPDGMLEVTKITKDSTGKTQKTVTKVNLKDKM